MSNFIEFDINAHLKTTFSPSEIREVNDPRAIVEYDEDITHMEMI